MSRGVPNPKPDEASEPTPETKMTEDQALGEFAKMGQLLMNAANDARKAQPVVDQIEALLAKLNPKDYPNLADNPAVLQFVEQFTAKRADSSQDPPGTIYNRNSLAQYKKPFKWSDLAPGKAPWVEDQVPNETIAVTWQNLSVQLVAEQPYTGPACFWDAYREARRLRRVGHEHAAYMFKTGGRPSDPGVINEGTARVRATSSMPQGNDRGFLPGAGIGDGFYAGAQAEEEAEGEGDAAA